LIIDKGTFAPYRLLPVAIKGFPVAQTPQRRVGGPAWLAGEPTLTVGEIAARLAPIAPDIEATVQRIRHWTREGLMAPTHLHEGTGRHRTYPETAIYDASLLHLLTQAGFTISAMNYLKDALDQTRIALPQWRKKGGPFYLRASRSATGRTETEILRAEPRTPTADLTIIIDLATLFARVEARRE
jgi:DNA-binding transcriptional MerR regulator